MDLSIKWLKDYVDIDLPAKELCSRLTMTGSKVEGFWQEGEEIRGVVVGRLLKVVPHENSDHLLVCTVDVGGEEPLQIVTGAQNVREGDLVPVALDGSSLPGGVRIKSGKLRGVVSSGMLCSIGELGLTKHDFPYADENGIFILQEDCAPGEDIRQAIGLDDTVVEFEITSNRPDCLSVIGLARETSASFGLPLKEKSPSYKGIDGDPFEYLDVRIDNPVLCKRYIGGIVKNVKIAPSPRWLRERLRASGVRPINNLVDITNYVMLEYGQPMHAFDIRHVEGGKIIVRNAAQGERITTLDGVERELSPEMLVIADSSKPVAVAGVMGGEYSGIMDDTVTVVFESACFDGASVRRTARKLGMRTDASSRYEKGLDAKNCLPAILRAFELCELLGCGEPVRGLIDRNCDTREQVVIPFEPDWINRFLGVSIDEKSMTEYLSRLGFRVESGMIYSPSFRMDIESKADIAEEIARLYGYDKIPGTIITGVANARLTKKQELERKLESCCVALGLNQINTFSFISPRCYDKIALPSDSPLRKSVVILNPLGEDTSVMRTTVLPSMCEVLSRNYNNRNPQAALFELGTEYIPDADPRKLPAEPSRLAVGMYGRGFDFYSIKGVFEGILEALGINEYEVEAAAPDCGLDEVYSMHPGRSACVKLDGRPIAIFGELHPLVLNAYGIGARAYAGKLLVSELLEVEVPQKQYRPLPKYPATSRDISLVCREELPVARLERTIKDAVGQVLEKIALFDVYQGEQIEKGMKSVSFSLTLRSHEKTLTDEQADAAIKRIVKALKELGAEIR